MQKWNRRHIIIGLVVLIFLFYLRLKGIPEAEINSWYNTLQWIVGIIVFGHAANKYVDGKNTNSD